ncbi:putative bifunctional diguanylate cyclase/phosphodiesterase [Deinococcus petrolearius]|uniref:Bifunctional diguanylate cyclase/phosphodiesterase n=1 Tax=Deinococcus petrolearius TaxID=1751295 RepID=A0ABW1DG61_9DEIO
MTGHLVRPGLRHPARWWLGGALIFGLGIWSMHFIGMLALHSPVQVHYDLSLTLVSLLLAVLASGMALRLALRPTLSAGTSLLSGLLMGLGIAGMHYTGMAAIHAPVRVEYDLTGVALSVLIAVVASTLALFLAFSLRSDVARISLKRAVAALVMGLAISSMHYTGMGAAHFSFPPDLRKAGVDHALALTVSAAALLLSVLFILSLGIHRRFAEQMRQVHDQRTRLEADIQHGEELYRELVGALYEGVVLIGPEGLVMSVNASAERLLGRPARTLIGLPYSAVAQHLVNAQGQPLAALGAAAAPLPDVPKNPTGQVVRYQGHGQNRWFLGHLQSLPRGRSVYSFVDITQEREIRTQLEYRANHDDLTGLLNRHQFKHCLLEAMYASFWTRDRTVVLFLDLNHFKDVNDTLGHLVGDELLKQLAARLRAVLPPGTSVARFGGDEFCVLLEDVRDADEAFTAAQRLYEAMGGWYPLADTQVHVDISIGFCVYPDDAHDEETLLGYADLALYEVKKSRTGSIARFDLALARRRQHHVQLGEALREAVEHGDLTLHYQPVEDLHGGGVRSCEGLLRWRHAEWGMVSPADFIPLAEELGLIHRLGLWTIEQACAQARLWHDQGMPLRVAVNISPLQFHVGTLPQAVFAVLERTGLPPAALELEVTESTLIHHQTQVQEQLARLRARGVTIALDDFGTGYSSLSLLQNLQVDKVKLDRSFVRELDTEARQRALVGSLIDLLVKQGVSVVAEGIETQSQYDLLRELGCPLGQGFLMCRPLPADELTRKLRLA